MATTPNAPARICVGCLLSPSSCSCTSLNPSVAGAEHLPPCRCGRLTIVAEGGRIVAAAQETIRAGLAERDPLIMALAGLCRCGQELRSGRDGDECAGCNRLADLCECPPSTPAPRRVCLDCSFDDPSIQGVVAHVQEHKTHRIDLTLVDSTRGDPRVAIVEHVTAENRAHPFRSRLAKALEHAEAGAQLLTELGELTAPPEAGGLFLQLVGDAQARARRQREYLRALVAVLRNPGARITLEGGRPVVHVPQPVTVEELGAEELPPEDLETTEIRTVAAGEGVARG